MEDLKYIFYVHQHFKAQWLEYKRQPSDHSNPTSDLSILPVNGLRQLCQTCRILDEIVQTGVEKVQSILWPRLRSLRDCEDSPRLSRFLYRRKTCPVIRRRFVLGSLGCLKSE